MVYLKIVDKCIPVLTRKLKIPYSFDYRGKQRVEQILEVWLEAGEWWEDKPERVVYRVRTSGGGMFELYRHKGDRDWFLYKIYD